MNRVISFSKKAKNVLNMSKGTTNIKITLERDGFNLINSALMMKCEIDNRLSEADVK